MELCKEYKPICFYENSQSFCENFDLDFQENLPQYLDDIERIVKCSIECAVTNYSIHDNKLNIHGKASITLCYVNNEECALSTTFEEDFSKSVDIKSNDKPSFANVKLRCKYSNFRLINQRRIDVCASLCADICIYSSIETRCLTNCKNSFVKESKLDFLETRDAGTSNLDFDETVILSADSQIKNIVNSYVTCFLDDVKIVKEKMLVKLNVQASIVYLNDDNCIEKYIHKFSLSKIIDVKDFDGESKAFVNCCVSSIYLKTLSNEDNALNKIEIISNIAINYCLISQKQENVITDSYLPHYDTNSDLTKITLKSNPIFYSDSRTDELMFTSEKNIIEVLDIKPVISECVVSESVIKANVLLSVLFYDDNSRLCSFEESQELSILLNDYKCCGDSNINIISFDYILKGSNEIALRLNYSYTAYLYEIKNVEFLTDIYLGEEKEDLNIPELTLYFADKGEDVWNIAKKFSTDMSLIMRENSLSTETIENKMVLLVPGM